MKKILVLSIAMLMGFLCEVQAQSVVSQLRKYCIVDKYAEYILQNASGSTSNTLRMFPHLKDVNKEDLSLSLAVEHEWVHSDVPLSQVALDLWDLISKQLDGSAGKLTLTMVNYIPIRGIDNVTHLACTMWDDNHKKWAIFSYRVANIETIRKGSHKFSL